MVGPNRKKVPIIVLIVNLGDLSTTACSGVDVQVTTKSKVELSPSSQNVFHICYSEVHLFRIMNYVF